jgi:thioredoxin reductase (NADPH)
MPVAQKSGKLLAHRLSLRKNQVTTEDLILDRYTTDYSCIPTTVFSPTEYSFVGLSEAEAIEAYGEEGIEVYHREALPLQLALYKANTKVAYMKVITTRSRDPNVSKGSDEKVLGIHYYGPAADELIGGFAVAMKLGMTKRDLDSTIGVHPSVSEDLFNMEITKRSGADFRKTGC